MSINKSRVVQQVLNDLADEGVVVERSVVESSVERVVSSGSVRLLSGGLVRDVVRSAVRDAVESGLVGEVRENSGGIYYQS